MMRNILTDKNTIKNTFFHLTIEKSKLDIVLNLPVLGFILKYITCSDRGSFSHAQLFECPGYMWSHRLQPARLLCPWNSPGNNTGVGCHSLLQGIFLTQGSNLGLLHCRPILYHLSHQGSPIFSEGDLICLNWSIVNLQCCVRCWCTAKFYIYIYICVYIYINTHI